jgi:hypothetical protein
MNSPILVPESMVQGQEVIVIADEFHRLGFKFEPEVVRATVPPAVVGTYCLFSGAEPIYVGRSDHCLRTRLTHHPYGMKATHFMWEPCTTPWSAFCLEAYWWHSLASTPSLRNAVHPGRPVSCGQPCPFCNPSDVRGLAQLLPWVTSTTSSNTISTTKVAVEQTPAAAKTQGEDNDG